MTKEKIINILKKAVYYVAMAVLIALLVSSTIITIGVTVKAADIAYDNGGHFADLVDRLADTFSDTFSDNNNYSKATKGIVANAATIDGIDYPPLDTSDLLLFHSESDVSIQILRVDNYAYSTIYIGDTGELPFVQYSNYYLDFTTSDGSYFYGYFVASDNIVLPSDLSVYQAVSCFGLTNDEMFLSHYSAYCYVLYNDTSEEYYLYVFDPENDIFGYTADINIYSIPTNTNESTTTESLTDILGNSINFSTSAITTSVKEVFEGLFVNENNTISNYATYVVWFSGIAIALGFFKYILRFILTMGDKK